MEWASGVGFSELVHEAGAEYSSAHEYRQRHVVAALLATRGVL